MIVTCPNCAARYDIPEHKITGEGRPVLCDACQTEWFVAPVDTEQEGQTEAAQDAATPASQLARGGGATAGSTDQPGREAAGSGASTAKPSRLRKGTHDNDAQAREQQRRKAAKFGWYLLIVAAVALVSALVIARHEVVKIYPPAEMVYEVLGLEAGPKRPGLTLGNLKPLFEAQEDGSEKITMIGTISNTSKSVLILRKIVFKAYGDCNYAPWYRRFKNNLLPERADGKCLVMQWAFDPSDTKIAPYEQTDFSSTAPVVAKGVDVVAVEIR